MIVHFCLASFFALQQNICAISYSCHGKYCSFTPLCPLQHEIDHWKHFSAYAIHFSLGSSAQAGVSCKWATLLFGGGSEGGVFVFGNICVQLWDKVFSFSFEMGNSCLCLITLKIFIPLFSFTGSCVTLLVVFDQTGFSEKKSRATLCAHKKINKDVSSPVGNDLE